MKGIEQYAGKFVKMKWEDASLSIDNSSAGKLYKFGPSGDWYALLESSDKEFVRMVHADCIHEITPYAYMPPESHAAFDKIIIDMYDEYEHVLSKFYVINALTDIVGIGTQGSGGGKDPHAGQIWNEYTQRWVWF